MASQRLTKAVKTDHGHTPGKWDSLEPIFDKLGMQPEWALKELKKAITEGNPKDRVRAIDLWAKLSGFKPPERVYVSALDGLVLDIGGCEKVSVNE